MLNITFYKKLSMISTFVFHLPHAFSINAGCGKPDIQGVSRVVAGKTATPNSRPWQILMMFGNRAMCGGTLIAPQWVVTAAHCVYRKEQTGAFSIR